MKLATFFIRRTNQIYAKVITVSKSKFEIKVVSAWTLFEILLTSAVISKQKLLQENEIVHCFQN